MTKKNKVIAIFKLLLLFAVVGLIPLYIWFFHKDIIDHMSSLKNVEIYFYNHPSKTALSFLCLQILQVIISIIPGQWLQIGAAYFYGFWIAYLISILGAAIGTVIAFYISKFLGHDAVHVIFGKKKIVHWVDRLNSKKAALIMFFIFLVPGLPKDLLAYAAGLSDMKLKTFLAISLLGRTPAMFISISFGMFIKYHSYTGAVIISLIALLTSILGIVYRHKLHGWIDKVYTKISS